MMKGGERLFDDEKEVAVNLRHQLDHKSKFICFEMTTLSHEIE